jgi:hypothetical protein
VEQAVCISVGNLKSANISRIPMPM